MAFLHGFFLDFVLRQNFTLYEESYFAGGGFDVDTFIKGAELLFGVVDDIYLATLTRGDGTTRVLDIDTVATCGGALYDDGRSARIGKVEDVFLLVALEGEATEVVGVALEQYIRFNRGSRSLLCRERHGGADTHQQANHQPLTHPIHSNSILVGKYRL